MRINGTKTGGEKLKTMDGQAIISENSPRRDFNFHGTVKAAIRFPEVFRAASQSLLRREFGMMYRETSREGCIIHRYRHLSRYFPPALFDPSFLFFLPRFEHVGTSIVLLCIYESRFCRSFNDWCDFSDLVPQPRDDSSSQVGWSIIRLVIATSRRRHATCENV